jgi:hypothetical protein
MVPRGQASSFMPRYHFDLALGQARICDPEGVDLPDEEAARWHALNEIRELLATSIGKRLGKNCLIKCAIPEAARCSRSGSTRTRHPERPPAVSPARPTPDSNGRPGRL